MRNLPLRTPESRTQPGAARQDTISLCGLTAVGFHGVLDHERRDGQPFVVDLVLHLDLWPAGRRDDLALTVDYGELAEQVKAIITAEPLNLIEALAEKIAQHVLAGFSVDAVEVVVHKPEAPIAVPFGDVAVSIVRART